MIKKDEVRWIKLNKPQRNKKNQQGAKKPKIYQNLQKIEKEKNVATKFENNFEILNNEEELESMDEILENEEIVDVEMMMYEVTCQIISRKRARGDKKQITKIRRKNYLKIE